MTKAQMWDQMQEVAKANGFDGCTDAITRARLAEAALANRPVGEEALRDAEILRRDLDEAKNNLWVVPANKAALERVLAALPTVAPPATPALEAGGEEALRQAASDLAYVCEAGLLKGPADPLIAEVRAALTPPRGPDQSGGEGAKS